MSHLLEVKQLEKKFAAVVAASDININIDVGEIIGVIGSNGAGKTTFVNMVTGYLKPSSGEIIYRGENITGRETREITKLGICRSFQIPQLFLELTVLDNIIIALSVVGKQKTRYFQPVLSPEITRQAMGVLERFNVQQYAQQLVTTLPQGVRKLIDIAMATVGNPDLLFLDEPTSGVSAEEKMQIMEVLISALKNTDTAVLFIEHDMEIVEAFSSRVLAFYEGTVLADGSTAEVLADPKVREYVIGTEFHRQAEGG